MKSLLFCLLAVSPTAVAQKQPVTLEALASQQPPSLGVRPIWSADGKRLAYQRGGKLIVYEIAARRTQEVVALQSLVDAAVKVPEPERFAWQNRRVREETIQWLPDGQNLIVLAGGDVFLVRPGARGWTQLTATPFAERDPKLSPDGKKLAYRKDHDLYVLDLAGGQAVRLTEDGSETLLNGELDWVYPEELDLGTAYWWAPDSKSIAFLQLDIARELVHPHVDLLGLFAKAEPQRYPKAGTANADVRLGVVSASGGAVRWMDLGEMRERLLARVYWAPESQSLMVIRMNRVQNELHLIQAEAATGRSKILFEEKDAAWINVKDEFRFLPVRKQFLWGSERDGWRHLYLINSDGTPAAQLTKGDWEVTGVVHVDEKAGQVYFTSTEESPLERHFYRVSLDGGQRQKLTREPGTHTVSMCPTGEFWTDSFSSLKEPPRTCLRSGSGELWDTLVEPDRKAQQQYDLLPVEIHTFKGEDGTLFYARLIKPAGFDPSKKYPAVVMVYGGPGAQTVRNSWSGLNWDQVLAHRGFVIWQMDNRGSAGRGHAWEARLYRRFGRQELEDQQQGVKYLIGLGFVDEKRIGITGWSYGGFLTLYAMLHAPQLFRAGIAGAAVTDWRHYDTIYTERYLGLPAENPQGYRDSSPVHAAANLQAKLLLVHNFGDDNVLYQHCMQMQVELEKAGKQFELLVYPQKAHGVTRPFDRHMRQAMTDFFERTLKP